MKIRVSAVMSAALSHLYRYTASSLGVVFGRGISNSGTIVGGTCPTGFGYVGGYSCGSSQHTNDIGATAAAIIGGKLYQLSSVADLSSCAFDLSAANGDYQAMAVSESGAILVEGFESTTGYETSCLLTPTTPLSDGTPQFTVSPL